MTDNFGLAEQREGAYMPQDDDELGYLRRRRSELLEFQRELAMQLQRAQERLRAVEAALAAFGEAETSRAGDTPRRTIKEGVLEVLSRVAPRGLSALGILERLRTDLGMDYERTSLSPQLSRLKNEGKIKLDGGVWFKVE